MISPQSKRIIEEDRSKVLELQCLVQELGTASQFLTDYLNSHNLAKLDSVEKAIIWDTLQTVKEKIEKCQIQQVQE